jgi:hypothetical protein
MTNTEIITSFDLLLKFHKLDRNIETLRRKNVINKSAHIMLTQTNQIEIELKAIYVGETRPSSFDSHI